MDLEKERKLLIRPYARYPIFLLGLLLIVVGGVLAIHFRAGESVEELLAVVGFVLLVLSVTLR